MIESPDIKVNGRDRSAGAIEAAEGRGGCIATTEIDTEDNLSVGDVNDELKPSVPVQPEADIEAEVTPPPPD